MSEIYYRVVFDAFEASLPLSSLFFPSSSSVLPSCGLSASAAFSSALTQGFSSFQKHVSWEAEAWTLPSLALQLVSIRPLFCSLLWPNVASEPRQRPCVDLHQYPASMNVTQAAAYPKSPHPRLQRLCDRQNPIVLLVFEICLSSLDRHQSATPIATDNTSQ